MTNQYYTIIGAKIDNYIIPFEDVKDYLASKDYWRQYLINYFQSDFYHVTTAFKGSQDGEAIVAYDEQQQLQFVFHLDPRNLTALNQAQVEQKLDSFLQMIKK